MPNRTQNTSDIQFNKQSNKAEYSSIQRKELFLWLANASESVLCEVMAGVNPAPYKKLMGADKARLHALLVSADRVRSAFGSTGRKNPDHDLATLEETHAVNLAMVRQVKKRRSPKREKIALHAGVIRQLFEHGLSLRQVCTYLKRQAGLTINPSYLRQCCREMGIETPGKKRAAQAHEREDGA